MSDLFEKLRQLAQECASCHRETVDTYRYMDNWVCKECLDALVGSEVELNDPQGEKSGTTK